MNYNIVIKNQNSTLKGANTLQDDSFQYIFTYKSYVIDCFNYTPLCLIRYNHSVE